MSARPDTARALHRRLNPHPAFARVVPYAVGLLAVVVFANALAGGFVLDDEGVVLGNALVHDVSGVWRAFVTPYWPNGAGQYRPLVLASFALEWNVWGADPRGYHALNLVWHAVVTALVYVFARRWLSFGGSVVAAVLFAVHPVHVEAVANIVGRAELMAAAGVLGMLVLHARGSPWSVVCFAAALLSKEHAIVAPALALVLDVAARTSGAAQTREHRDARVRRWTVYAAYAVVAVAWGIVVFSLFRTHAFSAVDPVWQSLTASARWLTMLGVVPIWVRLWFAPYDLSADYSPRVVTPWPDGTTDVVIGALLLFTALATLVVARTRAPVFAVAIAWLGIAMAPVANIVVPTGVIVAERTLYLASVGAVIIVAGLAEHFARRAPRGALIVVALAALAAGARTWTRTPVWASNRSLLIETARTHPEASWTHVLLGRVYAGNGGYGQAVDEYRRALTLFPANPVAWTEAIQAASAGANWDLADSLVVEARRRVPRSPANVYGIAVAHAFVALERGRYTETIRVAREGAAAAPDSGAPALFQGLAWVALGVPDSARAALRRVRASDPLRPRADSILATLPP